MDWEKIAKKLILLFPFIASLLSLEGSCATSCPYGLVNDPYPGQCPRYTDLNGDGFCDFSQTLDSVTADNNTGAQADNVHDGNVTTHTIEDKSGFDHDYHIIPVSLIILGLYLFTYYLFKRGYIKRSKHRRLWNLLLTFGYAGTGFTGFLLIFFIRLGIKTALNPTVTYWHAEMAILMVVATFLHIHIYWKPFKSIFSIK
ncbi:MAG TPA: hypothetical protein PLO64_03695 [Methanothermobacter sp.]|nr:conserved hypothetical protein [Methanothermobacter sp. MT-2]HHW05285.1 hypothetical protein [Methanothermobacter sp.]HOK72896.1 hypothetical protein [Methanothermobacter sp.]HOL69018.1 hypothetical protein [Methanothermobacter sp.]HPQ04845.1 hypothetical protein [Methanothermobacter sp.]